MSKKHLVKSTTLLLCFALIFSFGFSLQTLAATTTKDVTSQVVLLGNPFNKGTYAKNVWDMQVYNGRIYLGHGDYNSNAGPIPVIYYDPNTNKFVTQYSVNDEQIDKYKVLNGKLYIPGVDARESWDYGNFYVMDNDQWTKFRTIPKAVHVFDMAYFNGQLYAATGTAAAGWGEVLMSKDMGKTWTSQVQKTSNPFITKGDWTTTLFEFNNKLYATGELQFPPAAVASFFAKYRNLLVMNGESSVVQPYDNRLFPGASIYYTYNMLRTATINNKLLYLGVRVNDQWSPEALYVATSIDQARRVTFPTANALPTDIVIRGNTTYVSAYVRNSTNSYTNIVYKSEDLENWTELFKFNTATFVRSFEELKGDFYFGLGCNSDLLSASTGNILKVPQAAYQTTPVSQLTPVLQATALTKTTPLLPTTPLTITTPVPPTTSLIKTTPIIIDNTDSGFTSDTTWKVTTAASGNYGTNYLYNASFKADLTKWAKWTPNITVAGTYNIYMRWTSSITRPLAAPLEIQYNGKTDTTKTVNQQKNHGTWVLIGTYNLSAGTGNYVKILCTSPGYTIADAVKFEKTADN